jgi:secondary thiamine-phosphate synthase enzyme
MEILKIKTKKPRQILDITDDVTELLANLKFKNGLCHLFVTHTTCALTTADLDPGTDLDILDALESMIPKLKFRHPHDPEHVPEHIWATIIGPSTTVPIKNGKPVLGTWQRIVMVELSGARTREISISLIPAK